MAVKCNLGYVLALVLASRMVHSEKHALLLIDVQDCFLESKTTSGEPGSLAVIASAIIPKINSIREKDCQFDLVARSRDFHPAGHISFADTNEVPLHPVGAPIPMKCIKPTDGTTASAACCPDPGPADDDVKSNLTAAKTAQEEAGNGACKTCFDAATTSQCFAMSQAMWPNHCLQDGDSTFPPTLTVKDTDIIVKKGQNMWVDAYSAFFDNTKNLKTPLNGILKENGITHIYLAGIATDFCVLYSAVDAIDLGYKVTLIEDAAAGIGIPLNDGTGKTTVNTAIETMTAKGVKIMSTEDFLKTADCPSTPSPGTPAPAGATEATVGDVSKSARAPMMLALFGCAAALATSYH